MEVNETLSDAPETINSDPYGKGWMVKMKIESEKEYENLMDAASYQSHIGQ